MNQAIDAYKRTSDAARIKSDVQKVFDKLLPDDEIADEHEQKEGAN
jgi:hypothetical protein